MMAKENLAEMPENYDMMDEVKDCQLNGKRLEYTLRKPFDTLIKNHNIKEWSNIAIKTIEEIC